jgi:MFS transporter, SP family, arabinose:H+ symporter
MFGAEVVPAGLLLALLLLAPESPRWLLQAGREQEARQILTGVGGVEHAQQEIAAVREVLAQEEGRFRELFTPRFRVPLLVAVALMAFSQFSGINAIMYYSTKIFTTAGIGVKDAFLASVIVGFVNLLFTFVAIAFVDRAGRRPLVAYRSDSAGGGLGFCRGRCSRPGPDGILLLGGHPGVHRRFCHGPGPDSLDRLFGVFPHQDPRPRHVAGDVRHLDLVLRGGADLSDAQRSTRRSDRPRPSWVYAAFSLAALVFVLLRLPETKGRTLEQIEQGWGKPDPAQ